MQIPVGPRGLPYAVMFEMTLFSELRPLSLCAHKLFHDSIVYHISFLSLCKGGSWQSITVGLQVVIKAL